MCFPKFSPWVIGKRVYYDDTLLGHESVCQKLKIMNPEPDDVRNKIWQPEWDWTKRFNPDGTLAWDWKRADNSSILGMAKQIIPDWVKKSQLDQLDHTVERLFGDWQKLYEAFRRTDNVLEDYSSCFKLQVIAENCLSIHFFTWQYRNERENWWDAYYKLWKNPDNRIEVWRD
uniref:Uncharacterized protein n=1 Tax=viral metagenome TaxID=1070528 RepID=A0A6H1ZGS8_9ZZZZ